MLHLSVLPHVGVRCVLCAPRRRKVVRAGCNTRPHEFETPVAMQNWQGEPPVLRYPTPASASAQPWYERKSGLSEGRCCRDFLFCWVLACAQYKRIPDLGEGTIFPAARFSKEPTHSTGVAPPRLFPVCGVFGARRGPLQANPSTFCE